MRLCTIDDCTKPHRAKGMCGTHYNRQSPTSHKMVTYQCDGCGKACEKEASRLNRYPTLYCTPRCKTEHQWADRWLTEGASCALPADHWARWYGKASAWKPPLTQRGCDWCGETYTQANSIHTTCSARCRVRAKRARRRAKERNAHGTYTWAEVTHLWIGINRCCAYCNEPVTTYEPDHVIPLSKGGSNSITNVVPSCPLCNSDKRDLLLTEWYADRQRRQLPPREINPALTHLTWA
jgi:hypothetical protein